MGGAALIPLLGLACYYFPLADGLRRLSYDLPFLFHRKPPPPGVVLIYLDEESARALKQPLGDVWDRSLHTHLLDRLTRDGAKLVFYDIVFSSASADPAVDRDFARAIRGNGSVVLGAAFDAVAEQGVYDETIYPPNELLRSAAAAWGLLLLDPIDPDYAVREFSGGTDQAPTASWAAAERLGAAVTKRPSARLTPFWLDYYGPAGTFPSVSFRQALYEDGVPPGYFKDKIVFIGGRPVTTAITLGHDEFGNPYSRMGRQFMAGLEVHATEFCNLMDGDWLNRMAWQGETAVLLAAGIVIGILANFVSPYRGLAGIAAAAAAVTCGAYYAVWQWHVWFDWLIPVLVQAPVGIAWSTGTQYFLEAKRRALLRHAFSLYLSPHMADRIAESDFDLKPGGKLVEASIVFTDLKGSAAVAEELNDPLKFSGLLIDYFTQTSQCILANDGTIIKYIGDAVMAVWGAPLSDPGHASKAAMAAWQLCEASKLAVGGRVLTTRVGLSTGMVAAGNLGSPFRFDYTVMGDTVNLASRLEGLNKILGTSILVSDSTCRQLGDRFRTRLLGNFAVAGKSHGITVHELLSPTRDPRDDFGWVATFDAALESIRTGAFAEAKALLRKTVWERGGHDGPSEFYIKKMGELENLRQLESWTGLVRLEEKA